MFDAFYIGKKPGVLPHERPVQSIEHAQALCRTRYFWIITYLADYNGWDWLWEPPSWENTFRHAWPDQHQPDSGTYLVPRLGFTQTKFHISPTIHRNSDLEYWKIPDWIDPASVDFTWSPDPASPAYIYEFPVEWGWDNVGGPEYHVPEAVERKYVSDFVALTKADPTNFEINDVLDPKDKIFRWRPNPSDPPYVYVFGNQWWPPTRRSSAVYQVPGAKEIKYMDEPRCHRLPQSKNFKILVDNIEFDFSWEPDPGDPPYVYVFGNQWWSGETMPTVEYHVDGATTRKYIHDVWAKLLSTNESNWHELVPCSWDRTWVPDPGDPPYIYVFGNQWHNAEVMPTIEYHVPGATQRKFMSSPHGLLPQNSSNWLIPDDIDSAAIDYSWCPDPGSPPYIYHFGTRHQLSVGVTYTVPGATEIKFAGDIPLLLNQHQALIELDCFYIDFSNALSRSRFEKLKETLPNLQKVRYANSILDTLRRCLSKAGTSRFWVVSSHNDYSGFDFSWHPEVWQRGMIHVFGTQWNKWSDTFLINRWEFDRQVSWQTKIENFYNLNFVNNQQVIAATDAADIVVIDHGNQQRDKVISELSSVPGRMVRISRYFDNYLDTLRRVIDHNVVSSHVWICSTLCDYSQFDFSWQPEAWQRDMIHVFASGDNKFGDTFLVPVQVWNQQHAKLELLDWFETVNYVSDISVPRWPMPIIRHDHDSHMAILSEIQIVDPLILFAARDFEKIVTPTVSLWREQSKNITPLDCAASVCIVPRNALGQIQTQFYDYPHIDQSYRHTLDSCHQDVIFISYDEPEAEKNWEILKTQCSRAQRVNGVVGMEMALEAAADISTTPWYFAVFAKTSLHEKFDFSFVPDYMQQPKHYIFDCLNRVNGLRYGHMGIVLYHVQGVKQTNRQQNWGIDYTLSYACESIPILSCYGNFDTSPYHTWRTAFRETTKLAFFESQQSTVENNHRLDTWLSKAQGPFSEWCLRGAKDGLEFFQQCGGNQDILQQSFLWQWLRQTFEAKYGIID